MHRLKKLWAPASGSNGASQSSIESTCFTPSDYNNRNQQQILQDLNAAWDRIKVLQSKLERERLKRRAMTALIGALMWKGAEAIAQALLHARR